MKMMIMMMIMLDPHPPTLSGTGNECWPKLGDAVCCWEVKAGCFIPYVVEHVGGK